MLAKLRREYGQLVTSGAQLLLLAVGAQFESRTAWFACLAAIALISLVAWLSALYRLRTIRDTPTSKVASAAQGYVELLGRGAAFADTPVTSRLRGLPCLWYRYRVEERRGRDEWHTTDSGESPDSFLLRDASGECVIDPEYAEIVTRHHDRWQQGDQRYNEWTLLVNDPLYAIGELHTRNFAAEFDSRAQLNALLAEWKKDLPTLHARFDLDRNGELDMQEWMLARQAAKREVSRMQREAEAQPDIHLLGPPRDGKLFLISNLTPEKLSRRYLFWSWAHLIIFFGTLAALGWLLAD